MEVAETRTSVKRSIVSRIRLRNGAKSDLVACHVAFVVTKIAIMARDLPLFVAGTFAAEPVGIGLAESMRVVRT
jgi:hypothetical protein